MKENGRSFFEESSEGHIDLPRARTGGLAGGFFAVWVPDPGVHIDPDDPDTALGAYDDVASMPPQMSTEHAQHYALGSLGGLLRMEAESNGAAKIVRTTAEVRDAIESGTFAI